MNAGWVKLHRKIMDNPRSSDPAWFSVFSHLLMMATHTPLRRLFGSKEITLKPGQLITSRDSLSKKTGVQSSKVERILKTLKTEQQIEQESSSVSRLITILNWELYQSNEQPDEQRVNSDRTAGEQRVNTNKNIRTREHKNTRIDVGSDGALPEADQRWLDGLIADAAYRGINIPQEFRKCLIWCNTHNKQITRRRFVAWLNRADKPMIGKVLSVQQDWFRDVNGATANLEAYR